MVSSHPSPLHFSMPMADLEGGMRGMHPPPPPSTPPLDDDLPKHSNGEGEAMGSRTDATSPFQNPRSATACCPCRSDIVNITSLC